MEITIYTATGCTRCKIVKGFMEEQNISFVEKDMKAEGKEDFQAFYKANRNAIFRGPDGIEFPIITDGKEIRQGIGASVAYLHSRNNLDGFFSVGTLHKEWVDGIHVSGGKGEYAQEFIEVLEYLKSKNMKLQLDTNGKNSQILEKILEKGYASVVIMDVIGPQELYSKILGEEVDIEDIKKSLALITQFPQYKVQTTIRPLRREDGQISYLTPQELGETARLIKEGTGSNKVPYLIKGYTAQDLKEKGIKELEPLVGNQLFSYRTKARIYLVFADIAKE